MTYPALSRQAGRTSPKLASGWENQLDLALLVRLDYLSFHPPSRRRPRHSPLGLVRLQRETT